MSRPRRSGARAPRAAAALALAGGLGGALAGCAGVDPAGRPEPRPDLDAYRLEAGERRSAAGCRYDYRVFEPVDAPAGAVIIGHGFLRDQDRQVGLARALANAGHRAVTLDFCNMRPWNGHHERNAIDMRQLADAHGLPGRTVYAGFSAGALAALLAGADDPDALGVVTLDLVDQGGLGRAAAARARVPLAGLAGPASACNAQGNGRAAFEAAAARPAELVPGATHCDFELPSNWLCELACGASPDVADADADGGADADADRTPPGETTGTPTRRRDRVIARTVELVERMVGGALATSTGP